MESLLSDVYWTIAYAAMPLIILFISLMGGNNPAITALISIIISIILTISGRILATLGQRFPKRMAANLFSELLNRGYGGWDTDRIIQ